MEIVAGHRIPFRRDTLETYSRLTDDTRNVAASVGRARMSDVSMREAWESNAEKWIGWARRPGFDSYHQFHGRRFLGIVPAPGRLTIDLGAGEGRLARDLVARGHRVVALDASPSLARACATSPEAIPTLLADAAATPLRGGCADLVVAFMSLQDVDEWEKAIGEAARLLMPGGRFLIAIVHPINSAGSFEGEREDREAPFVSRLVPRSLPGR